MITETENMMDPMPQNDSMMQDEINKNQVFVTGITWNKDTYGKYKGKKDFSNKLPEQIVLTLPDNILEHEGDTDYYDRIETFVYNLLLHRFNHEAYHCQIWLPLLDQNVK